MRTVWVYLAVVSLTICVWVPAARAAEVDVWLSPATPPALTVGDTVTFDILADIAVDTVGWGLDVTFDPTYLAWSGPPTVDPLWVQIASGDGDGLVGLAKLTGDDDGNGTEGSVSGTGIPLASITFQALAVTPAPTTVSLAITPGDATEGFPKDPDGFATTDLGWAQITIVPEPATLLFVAAGGLALYRRTRRT